MKKIYQHIIQAAYIWGFARLPNLQKRRESCVWFFHKSAIKAFRQKARKRLWENYYFKIDIDFFRKDVSEYAWSILEDFENFIENQISDIENAFIPILINLESNKSISHDEVQILIHYMIHIHMRTKRKRREISDIWFQEIKKKYDGNTQNIAEHKKILESQWLNPDDMDKYLTEKWREVVGNTLASNSVIGYKKPDIFYQVEADRFSKYSFDFARITDSSDEFISSDHPVVIWKRCIIFPLNKKICLVGKIGDIVLTTDLINRAIASNAEEEIFGSNEALVLKYKLLLDIKDTFVLRHLDEDLDENALQEEYSRWLFNRPLSK